MLVRLVTKVTILTLIGSGGIAGAEPEWVPFSINPNGAVVVPVTINGRGPLRFLLDTGSSHSVVSSSVAARLDLAPVAKTTVLTSTGREPRAVVRLDQTRIGSARSEGLLASVAPAEQLAGLAQGVEGLIGQDFLSGLNYTLDYARKRLVWTSAGAADAAEASRLPLVRQEGRYLVQIPPQAGGQALLLVPDSGASGFVMFERNGRTNLELDPIPEMTAVHSLSGRQTVRTLKLRTLTLGSVTVKNQPVAVLERAPEDALEGDGLLPLHLFSTVTFNADHGYIILSK